MKRNCHQDWLMGRCGRVQVAAGPKPKGNLYTMGFRLLLSINSVIVSPFQEVTGFVLISTTLLSPMIFMQQKTSFDVPQGD